VHTLSVAALDAISDQLVYPLMGAPYDKEAADAAWKKLDESCEVLDKHLAARTYFVGVEVTLADIVMMAQLFVLWLMVCLSTLLFRTFPVLSSTTVAHHYEGQIFCCAPLYSCCCSYALQCDTNHHQLWWLVAVSVYSDFVIGAVAVVFLLLPGGFIVGWGWFGGTSLRGG
jgi:Glutathione S-transferase, C-terminal domain